MDWKHLLKGEPDEETVPDKFCRLYWLDQHFADDARYQAFKALTGDALRYPELTFVYDTRDESKSDPTHKDYQWQKAINQGQIERFSLAGYFDSNEEFAYLPISGPLRLVFGRCFPPAIHEQNARIFNELAEAKTLTHLEESTVYLPEEIDAQVLAPLLAKTYRRSNLWQHWNRETKDLRQSIWYCCDNAAQSSNPDIAISEMEALAQLVTESNLPTVIELIKDVLQEQDRGYDVEFRQMMVLSNLVDAGVSYPVLFEVINSYPGESNGIEDQEYWDEVTAKAAFLKQVFYPDQNE